MRYREQQLGFSGSNPDGLIAGVKVNDGIHFPAYAQDSQYADFENLFFDGPGFANSVLYVDFQRDITRLAADIALVINKAPEWSADWSTPSWTDDVIAAMTPPRRPHVSQPLLAR